MEVLLSKLRNDLASIGIKQKELAKIWGISPSGVSEVFKLKREMSCSFFVKTLIQLNRNYSVNKKVELFFSYLNQAKPENRREALELAYQLGRFDLLKVIIDAEKESATPENREWAYIFDLIHKRFTEPVDTQYYLNALSDKMKTVKTLEMKILLELMSIQSLYQTGNYVLVALHLKNLDKEIKKISNKYIKESLQIRLKEATCVISLQRGNIQESRQLCNEIFDIFENEPIIKVPYATALFKMGESYLFEDYETSKRFLEKAVSFLDNHDSLGMTRKRKITEYTLAFLKIHHGIELDSLDELDIHPAEIAYLKIKRNKHDEAVDILNELNESNNELSDIQTFYLGLAQNKEEIIKKSLQKFEDSGNIFYSHLPKKYLGIL
jgi:transcriptional regulator with XRE-family HTH domain